MMTGYTPNTLTPFIIILKMSLKLITILLAAVAFFGYANSSPMVESFGLKYKISILNGLLALDTGAVADVRLGYKLPLFSDRQYLAL